MEKTCENCSGYSKHFCKPNKAKVPKGEEKLVSECIHFKPKLKGTAETLNGIWNLAQQLPKNSPIRKAIKMCINMQYGKVNGVPAKSWNE